MKLPLAIVEFIGIADMPQFEPIKQVNLLKKTDSGMGYIEHPSGYPSTEFETNILFIDLKRHIKQ